MSRLPMMLTSIAVVAVCIGLNVHRYPVAWEYMRLAVSSLRPMDNSDGTMDVTTGTTSGAVRESDAEGRASSELPKKETVEPTLPDLPIEKCVPLDTVEMDKMPEMSSSESQQVRRISFPEDVMTESDSSNTVGLELPLLPNVENGEDKDDTSLRVEPSPSPECLTTPSGTDMKSETVTETSTPSVIEAKESDAEHATEISESRDDSSVALMTQVVEVGGAEAEAVPTSTENTTRTDSISSIASPIRQHRVLRTSKTQAVPPLNPVVPPSDLTSTHSVMRSISEERNTQKASVKEVSVADTPPLSKDVTELLPSTNDLSLTNDSPENPSNETLVENHSSVIWHSSNTPLTRQRIREMLASPPVEIPSH